jgi:xylulokinase
MKEMGMPIHQIHASNSNMFMSPLFRTTLANITGATIKLYDTDSATGAAKGAAIGAGIYKNTQEAFGSLKCLMSIEPDTQKQEQYQDAYTRWKAYLNKQLQLQ